jgi:hypothetical protein
MPLDVEEMRLPSLLYGLLEASWRRITPETMSQPPRLLNCEATSSQPHISRLLEMVRLAVSE